MLPKNSKHRDIFLLLDLAKALRTESTCCCFSIESAQRLIKMTDVRKVRTKDICFTFNGVILISISRVFPHHRPNVTMKINIITLTTVAFIVPIKAYVSTHTFSIDGKLSSARRRVGIHFAKISGLTKNCLCAFDQMFWEILMAKHLRRTSPSSVMLRDPPEHAQQMDLRSLRTKKETLYTLSTAHSGFM